MNIPYYNAKPTGKGAMINVSFNPNPDQKAAFVTFTRQVSWDATTRSGKFAGGEKSNNVKMNASELGEISRVIREGHNHNPVKDGQYEGVHFYHDYQGAVTTIQFTPYLLKGKVVTKAFGFSIKHGAERFSISLSQGQAEELMYSIHWFFNKANGMQHEKDLRAFKEKQKQNQPSAPANISDDALPFENKTAPVKEAVGQTSGEESDEAFSAPF